MNEAAVVPEEDKLLVIVDTALYWGEVFTKGMYWGTWVIAVFGDDYEIISISYLFVEVFSLFTYFIRMFAECSVKL